MYPAGPDTLVDVVASVAAFDGELTIYAAEPWRCDSWAIVAREPESGGLPPVAAANNASYFIEVFIAKEFLEGWRANERRPVTAQGECERLIYYALYDA